MARPPSSAPSFVSPRPRRAWRSARTPEVIAERVARLADMIRDLGAFVLHTGAGFSTAASYPRLSRRLRRVDHARQGHVRGHAKIRRLRSRLERTCAPWRFIAPGTSPASSPKTPTGSIPAPGFPPSRLGTHGSVYREACVNPECDAGTYERAFDVTATKPHHGRHRHKTGRACDACGWDPPRYHRAVW